LIPLTQAQTRAQLPSTQPEIVDLARDVFDRVHEEHLEAGALETVLTSLLAIYPDAPVAAHRPDGVMVPMPDSVPLRGNPVLEARSGLDLIIRDDRVLKGWERVLAEGAASYPVHPVGRPDITGTVYGLDLRETHGVILVLSVFAPIDLPAGPGTVPEIPEVTPRFTTLWKDQHGSILKVDEAITKLLGWSAEEMVGHRSTEFIHPDDQELAIDNWMEMLASPGPGRRVRLRHRRRDESWVWLEATNHNLLNDPDHRCVVSEMVDISEEMAAHEELRAREQLLDGVAEAIPVGLFQVDANRHIVYTNDRLHEILAVARAESVEVQLATVADADKPVLEGALEEVLREGLQADIEVELRLPPTGELRFCAISLRALGQGGGTVKGAIACVSDITDSARMRDELNRRATFDELTGCYNRASIMTVLEENIASGQRHAERAVVFVDLDGFKAVNDQYGHAAGDELLSIVARRLGDVVRDGDMVGRIGGDEFLAVCPDIGGPEQAMRLAERMAEAQSAEVRVAKGRLVVRVSIGVAWSSGEAVDADTIVAQADNAMYESKREGAGQPKFARAPAASTRIPVSQSRNGSRD
jgi:diguanylate cyclase (GGDEF)-like protein/PAS domain S-box-containing protein